MTYIYLITTFEKMNGKCEYGYLDVGDRRSVGWFPTFKGAERRVKNNTGDLWETCYDYAVIERIPFGLYPEIGDPNTERWYYKYNVETNKYELMDEVPKDFAHYMFVLGEIG